MTDFMTKRPTHMRKRRNPDTGKMEAVFIPATDAEWDQTKSQHELGPEGISPERKAMQKRMADEQAAREKSEDDRIRRIYAEERAKEAARGTIQRS